MIEFLRSRRKYLIVSLVSTAVFLTLFTYLSVNWMLVMTVPGQECFPYRHWVVKKTGDIHTGEYVAFRGHGIPNTPDKVLWGKKSWQREGIGLLRRRRGEPEPSG